MVDNVFGMNKTTLALLVITASTVSPVSQAAKLHAKALGEAVSAIRGSHAGWEYNPASTAYSVNDWFAVVYGEFNDVQQEDISVDNEWTSAGITFGGRNSNGNVFVAGLDVSIDSQYQHFEFQRENRDPEIIGGNLISYAFGFAYRLENTGWQFGATLKGNKLTDIESSEGPISYSLGAIKDWSAQGSISPRHTLLLGGSLGAYYHSDTEITLRTRYSGRQKVTIDPSSWNVGGAIHFTHLNNIVNHRVNLSLDIEQRDFLLGFTPEQSIYLGKVGAEWRFFGSGRETSSLQLALRGGMQYIDEYDLDPLLSYGVALTLGRHTIEGASWEEYLSQDNAETFMGLGYSFMF